MVIVLKKKKEKTCMKCLRCMQLFASWPGLPLSQWISMGLYRLNNGKEINLKNENLFALFKLNENNTNLSLKGFHFAKSVKSM